MSNIEITNNAIEELIASEGFFKLQPETGSLLTDKRGAMSILELRTGQQYDELSLPAMARNGRVKVRRVNKREQYYEVDSLLSVRLDPRPARSRKTNATGYTGGRKGGYSREAHLEAYAYFSKRALGTKDVDGKPFSNHRIATILKKEWGIDVTSQSINVWSYDLVSKVRRDLANGIAPAQIAMIYNIDQDAISILIKEKTK